MKKIGFVIPWFAEGIPGGAEAELRGLTQHMKAAGIDVEILTTCVREATANWNVDYYPEGIEVINNVPVRRFPIKKRNEERFNFAMGNIYHHSDFSLEDEDAFLEEMVGSTALYDYIKLYESEYELFVFIPYLFGTTYYGILACPEKSVLMPCLHDEPFAYMTRFKEVFPLVQGMAFLAKPEMDLAHELYPLENVKTKVLGAGVDTELQGDSKAFVEKYHIEDPFILYAGRKEEGKNVNLLLEYFARYKKRNPDNLKLVMIGGGQIEIPTDIAAAVYDLGYVPKQDKYDAYAAAELLCQPSVNESFSIVIMESWLCNRPVLVSGGCKVTTHFVKEAMAGLFFNDYFEFEGCINFIRNNKMIADNMGENGKEYVMENFSWGVIVEKYKTFFEMVSVNRKKGREYDQH